MSEIKNSRVWTINNRPTFIRLIILCLVIVFAGLSIYRSSFMDVFNAVIHREGSSHGVFVPFISAYFIWIRWSSIKKAELKTDPFGLILLIIGFGLSLLNFGGFQLKAISFLIFLMGVIWVLFGHDLLKEVIFPLIFLITLVPLPKDFYSDLAKLTRNITYAGSSGVISLLNLSFYQEGYIIYLPNAVLRVAESCSGVRYLISFFVFSIAYGYLTREKTWSRFLIVLSSLPFSLIASICRLTAIYLATYYISPRMAEHRPHILISWAVFFGFMFLAIAVDQIMLKQMEARKLRSQEAVKH